MFMKKFILLKSFQNMWAKNFQECVSQIIFNETILYDKTLNYIKSREQFSIDSKSLNNLYYSGYANIPCDYLIPITHTDKSNYVIISHNAKLLPYNIPLPFGSFLCIKHNNSVIHPYYKKSTCDIKHLRRLSYKFSLEKLVNDAISFINMPYVWGGRTIHLDLLKYNYCGVDCSGFINLLFRAQGILIPRDSDQQFLRCLPYDNFNNLPSGGLIFLTNQNKKIDHVMLKLNDKQIIDASKEEGKVRILNKDETFFTKNNILEIKGKEFHALFGKIKGTTFSELSYSNL